jgi:hypothetical protein
MPGILTMNIPLFVLMGIKFLAFCFMKLRKILGEFEGSYLQKIPFLLFLYRQ